VKGKLEADENILDWQIKQILDNGMGRPSLGDSISFERGSYQNMFAQKGKLSSLETQFCNPSS